MKTIDLSKFINSNCLMEFDDYITGLDRLTNEKYTYPKYGKLKDIIISNNKIYYIDQNHNAWDSCKPVFGHVNFHNGKRKPIPTEYFKYRVFLRDGKDCSLDSLIPSWKHEDKSNDIIGYVIDSVGSEFKWPWQ